MLQCYKQDRQHFCPCYFPIRQVMASSSPIPVARPRTDIPSRGALPGPIYAPQIITPGHSWYELLNATSVPISCFSALLPANTAWCSLTAAVTNSLPLPGVTTWCCSLGHSTVQPCQGRSPYKFIKKCKVLALGRDNVRLAPVSGCTAGEQPGKGNHTALKHRYSSRWSRSSLGADISALLRGVLSVPDGCQAAESFVFI